MDMLEESCGFKRKVVKALYAYKSGIFKGVFLFCHIEKILVYKYMTPDEADILFLCPITDNTAIISC